MTTEEKYLLLKDLCARLPYGVIVDYKENEFEIPHWKITTIYPETMSGWIGYDKRIGAGSESGSRPFNIGEVKPYLRPLSSMTEDECITLSKLIPYETDAWKYIKTPIPLYIANIEQFDFFNSHHLDWRGLIHKDLAIEVTEENNLYKVMYDGNPINNQEKKED